MCEVGQMEWWAGSGPWGAGIGGGGRWGERRGGEGRLDLRGWSGKRGDGLIEGGEWAQVSGRSRDWRGGA